MGKATLPDIEIKDDVIEIEEKEEEEKLETNIGNVTESEKESPFVNEIPDENISIEKTEPVLEIIEPEIPLTNLTKKALFEKCKSRGIKRYSKLTKSNLIKLLNGEEIHEVKQIPEKKKLIEKTEPVLEVTKAKKKEKKKRIVEVVEIVEESETESSSSEEEVRVVKKIVKKKKKKKNKEHLRNTLQKEIPIEKQVKTKRNKRKELTEIKLQERKLPQRVLPEYNPFKNMYNIE